MINSTTGVATIPSNGEGDWNFTASIWCAFQSGSPDKYLHAYFNISGDEIGELRLNANPTGSVTLAGVLDANASVAAGDTISVKLILMNVEEEFETEFGVSRFSGYKI